MSQVRLDLQKSCDISNDLKSTFNKGVRYEGCGMTRVAWRPLQAAVASPRVWEVVREQWRKEREARWPMALSRRPEGRGER